jgi:hypothetical protein
MIRWRQENSVVWMGEKGGCAISANTAMRICDAHNADIAALEAERDELRRRLDAVDAERENDWRRTL